MSARTSRTRHVDAVCEATVSKRMRLFSGDLSHGHSCSPAVVVCADGQASLDASELECPICLEFLLDPVVGPCGHDYCKACIHKWTARHNPDQPVSCPTCRQAMLPAGVRELVVCIRLKTLLEQAFPLKTAQRRLDLATAESESATRQAAEASVREVTVRSALRRSYRPTTQTPPPTVPISATQQALSLAQMREAFERGSSTNPTMPAFLTALSARPARAATPVHANLPPQQQQQTASAPISVPIYPLHSPAVAAAAAATTTSQPPLSQRASILAMRATLAQSHTSLIQTLARHHASLSTDTSSSPIVALSPLATSAGLLSHASLVSPFAHSCPSLSSDEDTSEEYEQPQSGASTTSTEEASPAGSWSPSAWASHHTSRHLSPVCQTLPNPPTPAATAVAESSFVSDTTPSSGLTSLPSSRNLHHVTTPLLTHTHSHVSISRNHQHENQANAHSTSPALPDWLLRNPSSLNACGALPHTQQVSHPIPLASHDNFECGLDGGHSNGAHTASLLFPDVQSTHQPGHHAYLPHRQDLHQHAAAAADAAAAAPTASPLAPAADLTCLSWHDQTADMSVRGIVADALLTLMLRRRPITLIRFQNRLVHFVQLLERNIYRSSTSRAAFADMTTLESRLQGAAQHILASNSFQRT